MREERSAAAQETLVQPSSYRRPKLEGVPIREQILLEGGDGEASLQPDSLEGGVTVCTALPRSPDVPAACRRWQLRSYLRINEGKGIMRRLYDLLTENANLEYKACNGYETLLGDDFPCKARIPPLRWRTGIPLKELWIRFYEENIGVIPIW